MSILDLPKPRPPVAVPPVAPVATLRPPVAPVAAVLPPPAQTPARANPAPYVAAVAVVALLLAAVGYRYYQGGGWLLSPKVTAVTYVYEKDKTGGVPAPVKAALSKLNLERGIVATSHEIDTSDGDDQIPDQYKVAVAAAKSYGMPCLAVLAGERLVTVVLDPKTEKSVLEAVP